MPAARMPRVGEVGGDQVGQQRRRRRRVRGAGDADARDAFGVEVGEADERRGLAHGLEADDAGGARRRGAEQGLLGEDAGVLEHVADGDDRER